MHNKISNFLVVNYDKIICPKLNKNNELAKKSCKLKTKVTRNMATLSHCKFYEKFFNVIFSGEEVNMVATISPLLILNIIIYQYFSSSKYYRK